MRLGTSIVTALACLLVFVMFVPFEDEVTVLGVVPTSELTKGERQYLSEHPEDAIVSGQTVKGKLNHEYISKASLTGKELPALATKKASICGCVYSLTFK